VPSSDKPPTKRGGTSPDALTDLDRRITAARQAGKPKPRGDKEKYAAMSMGWRIVIELVMSIMIGAAMGWGVELCTGKTVKSMAVTGKKTNVREEVECGFQTVNLSKESGKWTN